MRIINHILAFVLTLALFHSLYSHPYHVSVSEIKYNSSSNTFQISSKLFIDDIEDALKKIYAQKVDVISPSENTDLPFLLNDYIQKHLIIQVHKTPIGFSYVGHEIEEESIWCYFESGNIDVQKIQEIEITNTLLFDFITGQSNMIHCYLDANRQSIKLDQPNSSHTFIF